MITNAAERIRAWLEQPNAPLDEELRMHAVASLAQAGEWELIRSLLTDFSPSQRWAEARFAAEGSYSGYLADLELLWQHAEQQHDIGLFMRIGLIKSTIRSLSSNIPPELLLQFVTIGMPSGRLSLEAALEIIAQQAQDQQVRSIEALLRAKLAIPWKRALEIVEKQIYLGLRLRGFMALFPIMSPESQAELAERILSTSRQDPDQISFASLYHAQFVPLDIASELWRLFLDAHSDVVHYLEYFWDIVPSALKAELEPSFRQIAIRMFEKDKQHALHVLPFLPFSMRNYQHYGEIDSLLSYPRSNFPEMVFDGYAEDEQRFWRHFPTYQRPEILAELQRLLISPNPQAPHRVFVVAQQAIFIAVQMSEQSGAQDLIEQASEILLSAPHPQYFHRIYAFIPARYSLPVRDWVLSDINSSISRRQALELIVSLDEHERQPVFAQLALHIQDEVGSNRLHRNIDTTILKAIPYLPEPLQISLLDQCWQKCRAIGDQAKTLLNVLEYGKLLDQKLQLKLRATTSGVAASDDLQDKLFHDLLEQYLKDCPRALVPFLPFLEVREAEQLAEAIWQASTSAEQKRLLLFSLLDLIPYLSLERQIQLRRELLANPKQEHADKLLISLAATDQAAPDLISLIGQIRPDNLLIRALASLVARFDLANYPQQLGEFIKLVKVWGTKSISTQYRVDFSPILPKLSSAVIAQLYQAFEEEEVRNDFAWQNPGDIDRYLYSKLLLVPYLSRAQQETIAQQVYASIQTSLSGFIKHMPRFRDKHIGGSLGMLSSYLDPEQVNILFQTFLNHLETVPAYVWSLLFPSLDADQIAHFLDQLQQINVGMLRYLEDLLRYQPENDVFYTQLLSELEQLIADNDPVDIYEIVGEALPYLREAEQIRFIPAVLQQLPEVYGEQGTEEVLPIVLSCMLKQNVLEAVPIEYYIRIVSQLDRSMLQMALAESKDWIRAVAHARQQPQALEEVSQALLEVSYAWP